MQEAEAKAQRKRKQEVLKLVCKIRRLKNKLISYGMTGKQSIDAILYQFLKAPQIDWSLPHNTAHFYQIQSKFHTDHNTAQLILILNAIVPNWETRKVVQYLHQTLTYNALSFGIDLQISDDSSNQDGSDMTLLLIKAKKKNSQFGLKPKKRAHHSNGSNIHFYNPVKDLQCANEQGNKRIHQNQKIQEFKSQRKQTQQNFDELPHLFNEEIFIPDFNQNLRFHVNQQKQPQNLKPKKSLSEENEEKSKRYYPTEFEQLDEEKLEKKIKR